MTTKNAQMIPAAIPAERRTMQCSPARRSAKPSPGMVGQTIIAGQTTSATSSTGHTPQDGPPDAGQTTHDELARLAFRFQRDGVRGAVVVQRVYGAYAAGQQTVAVLVASFVEMFDGNGDGAMQLKRAGVSTRRARMWWRGYDQTRQWCIVDTDNNTLYTMALPDDLRAGDDLHQLDDALPVVLATRAGLDAAIARAVASLPLK